jgi:hypothetical protein
MAWWSAGELLAGRSWSTQGLVEEAADGLLVLGGLQQVVGCGAVTQCVQRSLVGGVAERGDKP